MTIFSIKNEEDFRVACLDNFMFQYENVEVYRKFVDYLNINPNSITEVEQIPFLPIEMFKNHQVLNKNTPTDFYFQSSGTTQMTRSKHFISDLKLYEESIYQSFTEFIGLPEDYIFIGLLPNYSENPHSSLIYMIDFLMKKSNKAENGYFLYNHQELLDLLNTLQDKKVLLFGVSFALLDFLDFISDNKKVLNSLENLTVIETGGMKGRKEEMTKDQLLVLLQEGYKIQSIFSEYSMTELLSQAYSLGNNEYQTPAWMRVLVRNLEDPFSYAEEGKTGAINMIDLANRHSCSFIATQDLGKIVHQKFQILGRIDHSDIRGCSLLVS